MIDLAQTGRRLNIRADVSEPAGSVRFNYDANPNYKVETAAAYAIGGNTGSDYWAWTPAVGTHTLVATAYAGAGGNGRCLPPADVPATSGTAGRPFLRLPRTHYIVSGPPPASTQRAPIRPLRPGTGLLTRHELPHPCCWSSDS